MRLRTMFVLLASAGSFAAYILLVERHDATSDEVLAMSLKLLPQLERPKVTRIGVVRGGVEISLDRNARGGWRIHPGDLPADTAAVERLLSALEGTEILRVIEDPAGVAAGLDSPVVSLVVRGRRVRLGRRDATGRAVYALRDDDPRILVVGSMLLESADRPFEQIRDGGVIAAPLREPGE